MFENEAEKRRARFLKGACKRCTGTGQVRVRARGDRPASLKTCTACCGTGLYLRPDEPSPVELKNEFPAAYMTRREDL